MLRRKSIAFFCALALLLNACGTGSTALPTIPAGEESTSKPTSGPSGENTGTTIAYGVYDYERTIYEAIVARFEAEHPEIDVVLVPLDDLTQTYPDASGNYPPESTTSMLRRIVSAVDVAPGFWLNAEGIKAGLALDMKPYMDADTSFDRADYYPGILERYSTADALYNLPRAINVQAISYNTELFQTASIPAPAQNWTFADMIAVAEQLTIKENGVVSQYGWYDATGGNIFFTFLLDKVGVDTLAMSPRDLKADDPKIIEALRLYKDYIDRGVVVGPGNSYGIGMEESRITNGKDPATFLDPTQMVRDGKVAMWNESAICCGDQAQGLTFPIGSAVMPNGSYIDTMTSAEGYLISSGTRSPQAAWTFVEWLTRQPIPNDAKSSNMPGYIYTRASLNDQFPPANSEETARNENYRYTIANFPPMRFGPNNDFMVYYNVLNATWALFEQDPKTPEQALQNAYQNLQSALNTVGVTPSPTPDSRPVVVATPAAQQAKPNQTTVTYAAYGLSATDVRRQLKELATTEPDIFVNVISTDNMTTTVTFLDMANRADCFYWGNSVPTTDAEIASVMDVQPLIDEHGGMATSDISPTLFSLMTRDGKLFGYPYAYTGRGLVYFPDALEKAGVEVPTAKWTPEDFLQAAKALTGNGAFGYSSMGNYLYDINFWVGQFGGALTSGEGTDLRVTFGSPAAVKAISWFLGLATEHRVMPMPVLYYRVDSNPSVNDPSYDLQAQGKLGMWFDMSLGGFDPMNSQSDPSAPRQSSAAMAPLPIGAAGVKSADITPTGFYVSANAQNPQACMKVIDYLSNQSALFSYGGIPARTSLAHSAVFEQTNAYLIPVRDALESMLTEKASYNGNPNSFYAFESYWLFEALDLILTQKADPAVVLVKAQETTNTYLGCVAKLDPKTGSQLACAKEADPNYKGYLTDQNAVPMPADAVAP
ncbi:MAG: hypothetical protein RLY87_582 [Chloroflexota bacterium]